MSFSLLSGGGILHYRKLVFKVSKIFELGFGSYILIAEYDSMGEDFFCSHFCVWLIDLKVVINSESTVFARDLLNMGLELI